jgi:hypothetical protein
MAKIATFLKGLIRRVKRMEAQILLTMGAGLFSYGIYYEVEHPTTYIVWLALIISAIGCWVAASLRAGKKEREEREQEQAKWVVERTESSKLSRAMIEGQKAILEELKKANQNKEGKG